MTDAGEARAATRRRTRRDRDSEEHLLDNLGGALVDYEVVEQVSSPKATHVRVLRKGAPV
jgi:hypothetical protein